MPLAALAQVPSPVANDLRAKPGDDLAVGRYRVPAEGSVSNGRFIPRESTPADAIAIHARCL
jgi:hypothetical protein